jgi:hypothetical protein
MNKKHKLTHEFVVATKEIVDNLLENMIDTNRTLTMNTVNGYARDMKLGRWMISDSSICVSDTGKTLNGMHRIHAMIKAGYPPIMISIMYGFPEEAIKIMDRGKPRSIADVMTIDGRKVSRKVVSACVVCLRENDPTFLSIRPTADDVTNTFEQVKDSFAYLNQADGFNGLKAPIMAALVAEHKHSNNERVLDFCKSYLTGAMLSHDSPILALRESLNQTRPFAKGFKEQRVDFYLTSTAIQSYVNGDPLTQKSLRSRLKRKIKNQEKIASAVNKVTD